jgi:hypothetical protein
MPGMVQQPAYLIPGLPSAMGNFAVVTTDSSGNLSTPAAGTTGQVLVATTSNVPSWGNVPINGSTLLTGSTGVSINLNNANTWTATQTFNTQARFQAGTSAAPAIANAAETGTGIYFTPTQVNVTSNGTRFLQMDASNGFFTFGAIPFSMFNFTGNNYAYIVNNGGTGASTLSFVQGGVGTRVEMDASGNFVPGADDSYSSGKSGARWSVVWAANGTIQTSDLNAKTDIVPSPLGLDFINALEPVAYKFKVGGNKVEKNPEDERNPIITPVPGKRQHFGLIAQQVKAVLPEGVDFGGWVQINFGDPSSEEGLRYDQFISPMIKAIQELSKKNEELLVRIEAMEQASLKGTI